MGDIRSGPTDHDPQTQTLRLTRRSRSVPVRTINCVRESRGSTSALSAVDWWVAHLFRGGEHEFGSRIRVAHG